LVFDEIQGWLTTAENPLILWLTVVPIAFGFLVLLLYIVFSPFISKVRATIHNHSPHDLVLQFSETHFHQKKNIAVAVDFSFADEAAIHSAFNLGGIEAKYTLIHVVETVGAMMYGKNTDDHETTVDEKMLQSYKKMLREKGFKVKTKLGFGKPDQVIPKIVNKGKFDILVMGTHGHTGFKDLLFGTTVDKLRHKISTPLLIVKNESVNLK
jgi:manganese transport protein